MVTELGLGAMDTPQSPEGPATLDAALDAGIDLIDTARDYAGSEFMIGQAIRARGSRGLHVTSKTFSHTLDGSQRDVREEGALAGLKIAQYRGLIDHIGVSSHSTEVLREAITCGEFAAVMLEYSAFLPETAPLIELASERDVGVIVMRPLGGSGRTSVMRGRIAEGYGGALTPASLLRYVLSNPAVSVAIPGARHPSRIHENVETAATYEPMEEAERRALEHEAAGLY